MSNDRELRAWLHDRVAELAGIRREDVDDELEFHAYGIDSAQAAGLAGELEQQLGRRVDVGMLYAHPRIRSLVEALCTCASDAGETSPQERGTRHADEPIAVIGAACRFPGAPDLISFWQLLVEGGCGVGEVPPQRWNSARWWSEDPARPGRSVSRRGGFVDDIEGLDLDFFGITAAEAVRMDPQQRMLLEVAWDAFEDAGYPPRSLRGSRTGVYVGVSVGEYGSWQLRDPLSIDGLVATGGALSVIANRLSYLLDFRGPSLAVDTACSSSLVAVHLAQQALLGGECDVAIAGGVNAVLSPEISVSLTKAGVLSADGICKSFDASADGCVRSEGCGAVVLKRLSDAVAGGDRILAVLLGSAVNQDGRSNGLTAPNPDAQTAVIRTALRVAGVRPEQVGYVEAHGSATPLGDRMEAAALGAAVRPESVAVEPCLIGSVKSNLGHLESAAGIAGLLKAILSVHHGLVPASIHVSEPNPAIDFEGLRLELVRELHPWERPASERIAGVSSFGFGGTNAHAVVRGYDASDAVDTRAAANPPEVLLTLSAHDTDALRETALRWVAWIERTTPSVDDLLATAASRTRHAHALAAVASSPAELADELRRAVDRIDPTASPRVELRTGFVFSGQGPSWNGNAAELFESDPLFASVVRRVDEEGQALGRSRGWLVDPLVGRVEAPVADQSWMQPAWFAVQVGLAGIWCAAGLRPSAVLGHSLGEIAAAHVAGALDLATAARVACIRGSVVAELMRGQGGLVATDLGEAEAREEVARSAGSLALAALNSPSSTVLSGREDELAGLVERLQARGRFAQRLDLPPSHSQFASEAADRLADALADLPTHALRVPTFSSVTGKPLGSTRTDEEYWRDNLRLPVRFSQAAASLLEEVDFVVELSPQPAVARSLREIAALIDRETCRVVPSSDRAGPTRRALLTGAAELIEAGLDVNALRLRSASGRRLCAPGTAWQRVRVWSDPRGLSSPGPVQQELLGEEVSIAALDGHLVWQAQLRRELLSSARDHRISGEIVVPAAAFIDALLEAGRRAGLGGELELTDLRFERFLRLGESSPRLQTSLHLTDVGARVEMHSRVEGGAWQRHVSGELRSGKTVTGPSWEAFAEASHEDVDVSRLYEAFARHGVDYGPVHRTLREVRRGDGVAVAMLRGRGGSPTDPAQLDGAFQLIAAAAPDFASDAGASGGMAFPVGVRSVRCCRSGESARAAARITRSSKTEIEADVWMYGADGRLTVSVEGLLLRSLTSAGSRTTSRAESVWSYEVVWRQVPLDPGLETVSRRWVVLGKGGPAVRLASALREADALDVVLGRFPADGDVLVGPSHSHELDELLAEGPDRPLGVVVVVAEDDDGSQIEPGERGLSLARAALQVIRSVSFAALSTPPRLVFVTSGAVIVRRGTQGVDDPASAVLRGLARVVPFENPVLDCRLIDSGVGELEPLTDLVEEIVRGDDADVALRDGNRYVSRLVPVDSSFVDAAALELDPAGAYVITGGTGGIGLALAQHLVERGARGLALLGHSEPSEAVQRRVGELRAAGARVLVLRADVGEQAEVAGALQQVRDELGPVRGVVHAAGTLFDRAMLDLKGEDLAAVLRPKVAGGWNLHRAVAGDDLDWFVCFSSAAGVLGSPGQAAYCAANAFLDALAGHRRWKADVATSIDWGPWAQIGAVADRVADPSRRGPATSAGLDPATAFSVLDALLVEQPRQRVILPYDLSDLLSYHPGGSSLTFFDEILKGRTDLASTARARRKLRRRPRLGHEAVAPKTEIERRILALWQSALGIEQIGTTDGFFELGGDSVLANQVLMSINREFGVSIDVESAFPKATVANLAALVEAALAEAPSAFKALGDRESVPCRTPRPPA